MLAKKIEESGALSSQERIERNIAEAEARCSSYVLLGFVRENFRGLVSFLLWLTLIVSPIGGFIFGGSFSYPFVGIVLGFLFGLVVVIIHGGIIAIFLNIDDNIKRLWIATMSEKGGKHSRGDEKLTLQK